MKARLILLIGFVIILYIPKGFSQTSYSLHDTVNIGIYESFVYRFYWFDYDNDNDLDLMYTPPSLSILENTGNGVFVKHYLSTSTSGLIKDLSDFDQDGDIDILLTNRVILKNQLSSPAQFDTMQNVVPNYYATTGWLNVLNYSNHDIIYITQNLPNYLPYFFYFYELSNLAYSIVDSLIYNGVYYSSSSETKNFDFNKDGYLDIIEYYKLLVNNGLDSANRFRFVTPNQPYYTQCILDIDNDGYLDGAASANFNQTTQLYSFKIMKNIQNNTFQEVPYINISNIKSPKQVYFDMNNDGFQDVFLVKPNGRNAIYRNVSYFLFFEDTTINNLGHDYIDAQPIDFDNDGDLDLAIINDSVYYDSINVDHHITYLALYRNDSTPPNTPPTPPKTLWTTMDSTKIIFHWRPATDVETPQATLSYNLMLGTTPKGIDIISPMSDTVTGFRRIVELGNAQLNNFYILDKSHFQLGDTLYWSVQTLDNSQGYSPFSKEDRTIVCKYLAAPDFDTLCSNQSKQWRGNSYNQSGRYYKSYSGTTSCDSTFVLDLKVHPAYDSTEIVHLCAGSTYTWHGQEYFSSGVVTQYHTTTQGCDSLERLILTVHNSFTHLLNEQICLGDSFALGNEYVHSSGTYFDSLISPFGCDSLVWLTLSVSPDDSTVIQSHDSLMAQSTTATIRWWNCNQQQYVYGAEQALFVPFQNGQYAAELTVNGCTYRTRCYDVTEVGMLEKSKREELRLQPNPAQEYVTVRNADLNSIYTISILTIDGRLIREINALESREIKIDISFLQAGLYILKATSEEQIIQLKLIVTTQ